jgi:hypothetical protein
MELTDALASRIRGDHPDWKESAIWIEVGRAIGGAGDYAAAYVQLKSADEWEREAAAEFRYLSVSGEIRTERLLPHELRALQSAGVEILPAVTFDRLVREAVAAYKAGAFATQRDWKQAFPSSVLTVASTEIQLETGARPFEKQA